MTHVITALCKRDASCVDVCPVDCIVPGEPVQEWPHYYIDPETCIDCGACVPECPYDAIFTEDMVPEHMEAWKGDRLSMPEGTEGFEEEFEIENIYGESVTLPATKLLQEGEIVDLTEATHMNEDYFIDGPGYSVFD